MTGVLSGLNWEAFAVRLAAVTQPDDDAARFYALAEQIETGALTGAAARAQRQRQEG